MDEFRLCSQVCPFIIDEILPDTLLDLHWAATGTYKWQCVGSLFRIKGVLC